MKRKTYWEISALSKIWFIKPKNKWTENPGSYESCHSSKIFEYKKHMVKSSNQLKQDCGTDGVIIYKWECFTKKRYVTAYKINGNKLEIAKDDKL